jgi:hypothetical protein
MPVSVFVLLSLPFLSENNILTSDLPNQISMHSNSGHYSSGIQPGVREDILGGT